MAWNEAYFLVDQYQVWIIIGLQLSQYVSYCLVSLKLGHWHTRAHSKIWAPHEALSLFAFKMWFFMGYFIDVYRKIIV
jgi:hypothetical protein